MEASKCSRRELLFQDQVAIVTGGADGLGRGIVAMLLDNGASVAIFDIAEDKMTSVSEELAGHGDSIATYKVDVSEEESVRSAFEDFRKRFDRLDVMVNCTGIIGPNGIKSDEVSVEDFDRVYASKQSIVCYIYNLHPSCISSIVNTRGSFIMTKYALGEMKKTNYGRILLVASISGIVVSKHVVCTCVCWVENL